MKSITVIPPKNTVSVLKGTTDGIHPGTWVAPYIPKMSLIPAEGRVHGARYYTVKPVFGNWAVLEKWAIDTYGKDSSIWETQCGRWYMNDSMFWFRDESDRTMFMLRWA